MAGTARIVNAKSLEQALVNAFEEWAEQDINEDYWEEQFFDNKWRYPSVTRRKNGEIVGPGNRNIADTQELYKSGVESFRVSVGANEARADWHWDAKNSSGEEYAWYVHEGQGPHSIEARKWTDEIASPGLFEGSEIKRKLLARIEDKLNAR